MGQNPVRRKEKSDRELGWSELGSVGEALCMLV
jgi:hypothetical protein